MIQVIADLFLSRAQPIEHPFVQKATVVPVVGEVEEVDNPEYQDTDWGGQVVKARVEETEDSIDWEMKKEGKNRLKAVDLDVHDWTVIRQYGLAPDKYKLTKPYVIAGWKYKDIGFVLGYSESWVQRIAPRIKDAIKLREGQPLP